MAKMRERRDKRKSEQEATTQEQEVAKWPIVREFEMLKGPETFRELTGGLTIFKYPVMGGQVNEIADWLTNTGPRQGFNHFAYNVGLVRVPPEIPGNIKGVIDQMKEDGVKFANIEPLLVLAYSHPEVWDDLKDPPDEHGYQHGVSIWAPGFVAKRHYEDGEVPSISRPAGENYDEGLRLTGQYLSLNNLNRQNGGPAFALVETKPMEYVG